MVTFIQFRDKQNDSNVFFNLEPIYNAIIVYNLHGTTSDIVLSNITHLTTPSKSKVKAITVQNNNKTSKLKTNSLNQGFKMCLRFVCYFTNIILFESTICQSK